MVEFALVFSMFLIELFALIDICRYYIIQNALTESAVLASVAAERSGDMQIDIRQHSYNMSGKISDFFAKRRKILDEAKKFSLFVLSESTSPDSSSKLRRFQIHDTADDPFIIVDNSELIDGAIIRPGESATTADGQVIYHPIICPKGTFPLCPSWFALDDTANWQDMIRNIPFIVRFEGEFRPILFLFQKKIIVTAEVKAYFDVPDNIRVPSRQEVPWGGWYP